MDDRALEFHLTYNHFPAVHQLMFPLCRKAITYVNAGLPAQPLRMPPDIRWRGSDFVAAGDVIESFHLDEFLEGG